MQKKLVATLGLVTILALSMLLAVPGPAKAWLPDDGEWEECGPRVDYLNVTMFGGCVPEFTELENLTGSIDITDCPLTAHYIAKWSQPPYNTYIGMHALAEVAQFEFDINNNETTPTYPNWPNPTYYVEMRKAMSYLSDKEYYIRELLGGYGVKMATCIMPWTNWYNPNIEQYDYNRTLAKYWLDQKFPEGTTPNPWYTGDPNDARYMRTYPVGHPKEGQDLDPLIGYGRLDAPIRLETGRMLRRELRSMGVPVIYIEADRPMCFSRVMSYMDYHFYTGAWSLSIDPDNLYDLYSSYQNYFWLAGDPYNPAPYPHLWLANPPFVPHVGPNYIGYQSPAFDNAARDCKFAGTAAEAKVAGDLAQEILADDAAYIPLWTNAAYTAYRKDRLDCVVNTVGVGVYGWYTFLNARPFWISPGSHPTIRWGWCQDLEMLNPAYSWFRWDWFALDKVYDTLLTTDPFTMEWLPHAATCEEGYWSYGGRTATKLTFHLRPDIYCHDGVQYTAADMKWLIDKGKTLVPSPWWYSSIVEVDHVDALDAYTLVVYFKVKSFLASHWIGTLPMLPKHIWETIPDWTIPMPDPNLIGTGPYKFVDYTPGVSINLTAYTGYFLYPPVQVYSVKTSVGGQATTGKLDVYVKNKDAISTYSVDVTLKVGGISIGTITLSNIAPSTIRRATWDVSAFAKGKYTLTVSWPSPVGPPPNWSVSYDNIQGTINTLEGDVDGDYDVDLTDTVLFSKYWARPLYDFPNEDLNNDGVKSVGDIPYIAVNYGQTDP